VRRIAPLVVCLAALGLSAPAAADDADVTAAVTRWSLKITKPAQELQTELGSASTPREALGFLRSFTTIATGGRDGIAKTRASSPAGTKVHDLARAAFARYAAAGRLLMQAVRDVRDGRPRREIEPKVKKAIALATSGSTQLTKAAALIPHLAGG
jgi:hypothetical protein